MSWGEKKLDELGFVGRGRSRHRPRNDPSLYGGEYPFIQTADIKAAELKIQGFSQTYNEEGLAQSKLWSQTTLCMTIAGENTAETAILDFPACFPDSIVGFVPNPEKAEIRFIKYSLDQMKRQFRKVSKGATQDNLSLAKLLSFPLSIPDLAEQKRIVGLVGAYEDLIENNRRRIALLDEAARLLYREWFVHFRFPGAEQLKIVDGVPEGWTEEKIGAIADVYRGKSYRSSELREKGGKAFVNLKCIERFGGFRKSGLKRFEGSHKEQHQLVSGNIVMAVTDMTRQAMIVAQVGRIPLSVDEPAIYSMDLVKVIPNKNIQNDWLYCLFRYSGFSMDVREQATGTNVLHLKPKYIEAWKATVPPEIIRNEFVLGVGPFIKLQDILESQIEKLTRARDLLLPRLLDGRLEI